MTQGWTLILDGTLLSSWEWPYVLPGQNTRAQLCSLLCSAPHQWRVSPIRTSSRAFSNPSPFRWDNCCYLWPSTRLNGTQCSLRCIIAEFSLLSQTESSLGVRFMSSSCLSVPGTFWTQYKSMEIIHGITQEDAFSLSLYIWLLVKQNTQRSAMPGGQIKVHLWNFK